MNEEKELTAEQEMQDLKEGVSGDIKILIDDYIEENDNPTKDEVREKIDYNGGITETVDGSVPVYNYDLMKLSSLSEVYHHDNELPPAFDGENTPINVTGTAIYEILMDVAWETLDSYLDELEEDGKFGEE